MHQRLTNNHCFVRYFFDKAFLFCFADVKVQGRRRQKRRKKNEQECCPRHVATSTGSKTLSLPRHWSKTVKRGNHSYRRHHVRAAPEKTQRWILAREFRRIYAWLETQHTSRTNVLINSSNEHVEEFCRMQKEMQSQVHGKCFRYYVTYNDTCLPITLIV